MDPQEEDVRDMVVPPCVLDLHVIACLQKFCTENPNKNMYLKKEKSVPDIAVTDNEIMKCFDVMSELRPHLQRDEFLAVIHEMQAGGYQLLYLENDSVVVAVAGFRISTNLFMGKHLYVDDLVTTENCRSQGHGEVLIGWLRVHAKEQGCRYLHLDSGTHRGRAHKFYFEQGFTISSYHFSECLVE